MALLLKSVRQNVFLSINATKTWLTVPSVLNTTNAAYASKTNNLLKKLGLPERPKKPLSTYMRFTCEIRPKLKASNVNEAASQIALQWKTLDDKQKQKYQQEFDKENSEYKKKIEVYNQNLTKEQKQAIKDERKKTKEHNNQLLENRELKNRLIELGKPKKPSSAFLRFYSEESKKSPIKLSVRDIKAKWDKCSEVHKKALQQQSSEQFEEYQKKMQAWEAKMLKKGLVDVVRKSSIPVEVPKKKASGKKGTNE